MKKILQEDFNDAYSRLLAAGIHLKMLSDFEARVGHRSYWKRPKIHGLRPLLLEHYYLALFLFAVTTTLSLLAFAIEVSLGRKITKGKTERRKVRGSKQEATKYRMKVLNVRKKKEAQVVEINGSVPGATTDG